MMETYSGKIKRVKFRNDTNGWSVLEMQDGNTVVGSPAFASEDLEITCEGEWVDGGKFGRQFKAKTIRIKNGDSDEKAALIALLSSGFLKGVKTVMARQIANTFGGATFDKLDASIYDPSVLQQVKGIGKVNYKRVVESWRNQRGWAKAALVAVRAGLTMRQAKDAYREWKDEIIEVINDNPYLLTIIDGVTWARADEIAALEWPGKSKIEHDDPRRYGAAVREVLRLAYLDGHMALTELEALDAAKKLALPNLDGFDDAVKARYEADGLVLYDVYLYSKPYWKIENETAKMIVKRLARLNSPTKDYQIISTISMSDDQEAAVKMAVEYNTVVITGGPGVGKSTVTKVICDTLEALGMSITLCAPTGKAARRLSEATGRQAGTLHRTLGIGQEARDQFVTDVVIIDECSMLDAAICRIVFNATPSRTKLILVGDVDQLPPVGAGEPFYQIIQIPEMPVARLTKVHRQSADSGIVPVAHAFNVGMVPPVDHYSDVRLGYVGRNDDLPASAVGTMRDILRKTDWKLDDVQVITPVNGNPWGQFELNVKLQAEFNPGSFPNSKGISFKKGDKVVHTKNNYRMGPKEQVVLNGMTGKVTWVASDFEEAAAIRRKEEYGDDEQPVVVIVRFDGEVEDTEYTRPDLLHLKLAYALTGHRLQGSECPVAIIVVPGSHPGMETRQWAYTALTRAKREVYIFSAGQALNRYVANEERVRRTTFLADLVEIMQMEAKGEA